MDAKEFWENVEIRGIDDCWPWKRGKHNKGYGTVWIGGKMWKAHRFAYTEKVGPIPDGLDILHSCDNPPCCNTKHLFPGTNDDNVRDMIAKGRNSPPPNMGGWNRFTLPTELIDLLGTMPDYKLGELFGYQKSVIARRRRRLGIRSFADRTGNNGQFKQGEPHRRWNKAKMK